jgi:hypothetical protein
MQAAVLLHSLQSTDRLTGLVQKLDAASLAAVLKVRRVQKLFNAAEHPRDENGEFTSGAAHASVKHIPYEETEQEPTHDAEGKAVPFDPHGKTTLKAALDYAYAGDDKEYVKRIRATMKHHFDQQEKLTTKERKALKDYMGGLAGDGNYGEVNAVLRKGETATPAVAEQIDVLKKAMHRKLKEDLVTFRGSPSKSLTSVEPGQPITDFGLGSTTLNLRIAGIFSAPRDVKDDRALIRIHNPKGSKVLVTPNTKETEVLYPPGAKFRVDKVVATQM